MATVSLYHQSEVVDFVLVEKNLYTASATALSKWNVDTGELLNEVPSDHVINFFHVDRVGIVTFCKGKLTLYDFNLKQLHQTTDIPEHIKYVVGNSVHGTTLFINGNNVEYITLKAE